MATINFYIQSKSAPAGIYVRLKEGRIIDAKAKTKFAIDPINWSSTKAQPKNLKDDGFKKLNEDLNTLRKELLAHFNKTVNRESINTLWLKEFINPTLTAKTIPNKLIDYIDYYATHKKNSVQHSTYKKINVNKNLLIRFQTFSKIEYFINDINADFKLKFEQYCLLHQYAPNTIARALKFIKTICYHAQNNGIETHFQLNKIIGKTEKVEKIFLTPDEIEKIITKEIKLDHLKNARDWLIISCETGQRVSDFMKFSEEQIRYESKVPLIEFTQVKTGKIMAIPLSKRVRIILDKRNGEFPHKISDQRYNEYIKEVCKLAEINKKTKGSRINKESGLVERKN
ncbi:MAG: phage integrase SAM-like domain-containing protein [Bacteroidota bacterium]